MEKMPVPVTAGAIASAIALSVVSLASPTELASIAGTVDGEFRLCYQAVAGANEWTLYAWDSASSTGASSPYRVNGTSGQWIAVAGKYVNSPVNIGSSTAATSASTGALIVAGGGGFGASTWIAGDLTLSGGNRVISTGTSDGSDTRFLSLAGGGAAQAIRGGFINCIGNEYTTASFQGCFEIVAGYDATFADLNAGSTRFSVGTGERMRLWRSGGLEIATTIGTDPGAQGLRVGGTTVIGGAVTVSGGTAGTPGLNVLASVAGDHGIAVRNSNSGTGSYGYVSVRNDSTASLIFQSYSSGYTSSAFGITAANYVGLLAFGASTLGLLIGCSVDKPIVIGVNNAEVARYTSSAYTLTSLSFAQTGGVTFSTGTGAVSLNGTTTIPAGKQLLLQNTAYSSSPSSNAIYAVGGIGTDTGFACLKQPTNQTSASIAMYQRMQHASTAGGTYFSRSATFENCPIISNAVTDAGHHTGLWCEVLRNVNANQSADSGTLTTLRAAHFSFGHYNTSVTTPITTNVYGINMNPYLVTGSCTSMFGIAINSCNGGGTLGTFYGLYIDSQTAGTTNYAIYTNSGLVRLGDSTASTSTSTGSLTVGGGVGIAGAAFVGNRLVMSRGTAAAAEDAFLGTVTFTNTSGTGRGGLFFPTVNPAGASTAQHMGVTGGVSVSAGASGISGGIVGCDGTVDCDATANTFAAVYGLRGAARKGGANTITNMYGVAALVSTTAAGTVGAMRGVDIDLTNAGGATITAAYGLRIGSVTVGATNYAILTNAGLVSIGDTTDATSTATGSITTLGGIGVAKYLTLDGAAGKTIRYTNATANAAVAVTFGAVGPTGSTAGNQVGWLRVSINGTDRYVPFW